MSERRLEVQWRAVSDDPTADPPAWERMDTLAGDVAQVELGGLVRGAEYEARLRYVFPDSPRKSRWTYVRNLFPDVPPELPPAPHGPRVTEKRCLEWEQEGEVAGVVGWIIADAPGYWTTWRLLRLHTGPATPPWPLCRIPRGRRTIAVKTVNEFGRESAEAALLHVDLGPMDEAEPNTDRRVAEEPNFTGLLQGGSPVGSAIEADIISPTDSAAFYPQDLEPFYSVDTAAPFFGPDSAPFFGQHLGDAAPFMPWDDTAEFYGDRWRWIEYVWAFKVSACEGVTDCTRLTLDVVVESPNAPYRLEYRRPSSVPFYAENDKAPFYPTGSEPFYGGGAEPWQRWPGKLDSVRGGEYRFRLLVPGGRQQARITSVVTHLSMPDRSEFFESVPVGPLGGTRVRPSRPFNRVREVWTQHRLGSADGARVDVDDKDRTNGPRLVSKLADGSGASSVVDVELKGF